MSASRPPKRLILNLFEMSCISHITHGLWRLPDNNRERFNDIEYWTELALLLESGGFDAVFIADVAGVYDVFRGSAETSIREGMQIPANDPLLVVPAMAAVTRHLGFAVTSSTSYEPPFSFARRLSTLDHLTKGRVGWNIVTSYLPNAARNFGHDSEIAHDERYEMADEYLDVLYKLWEGSWDEDAVLADRASGVFTDPAKVRAIDHAGAYYKVAGPHLSQPSRQRTPLLMSASASPRGIAFAGKHAEVLFTGGPDEAAVAGTMAKVRAAAVEYGRRADDVRFVVTAGVVVGRTQAEAEAKLAEYHRHVSVEGVLAQTGLPFDPTSVAPETPIAEIVGEEDGLIMLKRYGRDKTVGELIAAFGDLTAHPFFVAGDPEQVADEIERWLDEVGIDGINLRQYHSFDIARDFVELVVPVLRRRGRLRERYVEGETLRDRIFGAGDRLPDRHHATRYRGGAHLLATARDPLVSG